jgi:hypothetical protein
MSLDNLLVSHLEQTARDIMGELRAGADACSEWQDGSPPNRIHWRQERLAFPMFGSESIALNVHGEAESDASISVESVEVYWRRGGVLGALVYVVSRGSVDKAHAQSLAARADQKLEQALA